MHLVISCLAVLTFLVIFLDAQNCSSTMCQTTNCQCQTGGMAIPIPKGCCTGFNCVTNSTGNINGICVACASQNMFCGPSDLDHKECCDGLTCVRMQPDHTNVIFSKCIFNGAMIPQFGG